MKELRAKSLLCPRPLAPERFTQLQMRSQLAGKHRFPLSPIAMDICRKRDAFRDTVLVIPTESGEEMHYLFITAIQRPFML
eukprot:1774023-Amphidinium_carterae.1